MDETTRACNSKRIVAIDALRGLVIVLMALDHSRSFFGDMRIRCEDPLTTDWRFFLTRWSTHFCAPTFLFLAGISAWLHEKKRPSQGYVSKYLLTRGLWLLILEFTVIYFAISLSFGILPGMFLVISAIGCSMILLSFFVRVSPKIVFVLGLCIICLHNLLDTLHLPGMLGWIWMLLHDGPGYIPEIPLEIGYPVLPWFGVMCLGYGIGPVVEREKSARVEFLTKLGLCMVLGFFAVRCSNGYGNPQAWEKVYGRSIELKEEMQFVAGSELTAEEAKQAVFSPQRTVFSFLATRKYPPSLAYLLMTIGPACLMLVLLDKTPQSSAIVRTLQVFGRVPLFFYVLHFYVLHIASILTYGVVRGRFLSPFQSMYQEGGPPQEFGFSTLWQVYVAWFLTLLLLFPLCRLYYSFCKRSGHPIGSYL